MDLVYRPVDLKRDLPVAISFRKDTHLISFGDTKQFDQAQLIRAFNAFQADFPEFFLHIWFDDKIIGQLEFRSGLTSDKGERYGYINLIYIAAEYRKLGFGQQVHDFMLTKMKNDGCAYACLRYLPLNQTAERFYLRNHWQAEGQVTERGQLMVKQLVS